MTPEYRKLRTSRLNKITWHPKTLRTRKTLEMLKIVATRGRKRVQIAMVVRLTQTQIQAQIPAWTQMMTLMPTAAMVKMGMGTAGMVETGEMVETASRCPMAFPITIYNVRLGMDSQANTFIR